MLGTVIEVGPAHMLGTVIEVGHIHRGCWPQCEVGHSHTGCWPQLQRLLATVTHVGPTCGHLMTRLRAATKAPMVQMANPVKRASSWAGCQPGRGRSGSTSSSSSPGGVRRREGAGGHGAGWETTPRGLDTTAEGLAVDSLLTQKYGWTHRPHRPHREHTLTHSLTDILTTCCNSLQATPPGS